MLRKINVIKSKEEFVLAFIGASGNYRWLILRLADVCNTSPNSKLTLSFEKLNSFPKCTKMIGGRAGLEPKWDCLETLSLLFSRHHSLFLGNISIIYSQSFANLIPSIELIIRVIRGSRLDLLLFTRTTSSIPTYTNTLNTNVDNSQLSSLAQTTFLSSRFMHPNVLPSLHTENFKSLLSLQTKIYRLQFLPSQ